jgi:PIN domain nuclease of toxin-antitoxin system
LEDAAAVIHVSAASFWEVAIKAGLGRIDLGRVDLAAELEAGGFQELPIRARHALEVRALPRHHDDPFDRMLAAQARVEGLTLVSRDAIFARYGVNLLRA